VLTSPAVTVAAGATLAGTGTIIGNVANSGTISPGNSIGTLNITGNTSFASGSFLAVQANAAGAASKLVATGTATIGGGTVRALPQPGAYGLKTTYTILTANGGVTGTFANVTSSAFFTPSLTYDANDVFLTLARNTSFFASVAATPNQRSVGGALDASPFASTLVQAVLPLSAATAQQAFDALSGEIYASVQATLLDDSRYARQAILGRLRQAPYAGAPGALLPLGAGGPLLAYQAADDDDADALAYQTRRKPPFPIKAPQDSGARNDLTFWAQGFGTWGTFNGDGNAAPLKRDLGGFISGVDRMSGDWRLGAAMGYTSSNNQVGARASSAQVDTIDLAAYAGRQFGGLAVRTGAVLALHNIDVDRSIFFPGFADRATARFGASTTQIFGEAGYPVTLGRFAAEPFAGLAYVHLDMDKIVETGGPAALTGAGSTQDEGFSTLGVRAATAYLMQNGMMLIPRASIAWQHLIGQRAPTAVLAFQSTGAGFPVAGVPLARDGALIEAGFDVRISPRATAGVFYTGQIASGVHDNGIKGRFSWLF
jgi:outer membrane autotransporter protein